MKSRIQFLIVLFAIVSVNSNLFSQTTKKDFDWNEYQNKLILTNNSELVLFNIERAF